ncbi:MAG: hypothetical protein E7493_01725 [Ruminococcus albus]|nr:hypothetical protein [Ruminococcus albus]
MDFVTGFCLNFKADCYIPAAAGFWWNRCGASLFDERREPHRCADNAESIFFVVCIVAAALFYNMGIF